MDSVELSRMDTPDDSFKDPIGAKAEAYTVTNGVSPATLALAADGMERVGVTVWMLTMCAALCGSLFGYDTGYVSSVLVSLDKYKDFGHVLSDGTKQLITSATSLGALIGALGAMVPSEWLGRRWVMAIANAVFIVGAVIQAAAHNAWTLIGGRFVVGVGVGIASMIVPLWISELAPAHLRGRLVTLNIVFLTLGQLIATGVGAGFENVYGGWRYTVAGGAIPAIISLLTMAWLPESPRYDSRRGRTERAMRTFQRIYPHASEAYCRRRAEELALSLQEFDNRVAHTSFVRRVRLLCSGTHARALVIACGLQALQQLCGFNTLMYYSGTLFQAIGFDQPVAVSLIVSATNFLATLAALQFIDMIGRRRVLLYSVPGMCGALVFTAICFAFLPVQANGELATDIPSGRRVWTYLVIVAIIVYVLFYGFGIGNVPWQQGELFAIETRAIGTSIATGINWACNLLIGATYLSLVEAATSSGAFGFYAGLCAIGFVFCLFCFPDTRQLSLEEVHVIFRGSWGIRAAEQLRLDKARVAAETRARDAVDPFLSDAHTIGSSTARVQRMSSVLDTTRAMDPLDEPCAPRVPADPRRMNGATPAALPLSLPSDLDGPPLLGAHAMSLRRSASLSQVHGADEPITLPPIRVDGPRSNVLTSRYGLEGTPLLLFVTCFASLGVFMFGYDQGVMSGIITHPAFQADFDDPSAAQLGTMVAVLEIGALITSLLSGVLADRYGRKVILGAGALLFLLGGLIQTCSVGYRVMVVGRIIAGLGVGFLTMVVPTYQSEVSPAENRGKLACIEFTGNIIGYMASVWMGYLCSFLESGWAWRLPLAVQPLIGGVLLYGATLLPESPRWLCDVDRNEEAMRVLVDLSGTADPRHARAKLEFWEIQSTVRQMRLQGDRSYRALWCRLRARTLLGMSSQMLAQLNGINVISYYAPLVFESAGWVGRDALFMTGINAMVYVLSTVPTWFLVDSWGRRPILLSGALLCALMLGACGLFLRANRAYTPTAVAVCVVLFNAAFGYSWGPIPWAWTPEIMPLAFRAKGTSLAAATNWVFNWIVGQLTPILQETIGWRLYLLHAVCCLASFGVVYVFYPETQGVPLEEMDALFGDQHTPVPQEDTDTGEIHATDGEMPRLRRSISTHPRFLHNADPWGQARERGAYEAVPIS